MILFFQFVGLASSIMLNRRIAKQREKLRLLQEKREEDELKRKKKLKSPGSASSLVSNKSEARSIISETASNVESIRKRKVDSTSNSIAAMSNGGVKNKDGGNKEEHNRTETTTDEKKGLGKTGLPDQAKAKAKDTSKTSLSYSGDEFDDSPIKGSLPVREVSDETIVTREGSGVSGFPGAAYTDRTSSTFLGDNFDDSLTKVEDDKIHTTIKPQPGSPLGQREMSGDNVDGSQGEQVSEERAGNTLFESVTPMPHNQDEQGKPRTDDYGDTNNEIQAESPRPMSAELLSINEDNGLFSDSHV